MLPVVQRTEIQEPEKFTDGSIDGVVFRTLKPRADRHGWQLDLYREDETPAEDHPVMAYICETRPGVARGPHEHAEQSEYVAFAGPGEFTLYLWDIRLRSPTWGNRMKVRVGESNRQCAIIPPGVVHAYKNMSDRPGWVFHAPNRLYAGEGKRQPVDEICHEHRKDHMFQVD